MSITIKRGGGKNPAERELHNLVEELTTTGKPSLDPTVIGQLKTLCMTTESCIPLVYRLLVKQLRRNHAEIRYSALQVINEIYLRSHLFRSLVSSRIATILELILDFLPSIKLPKPESVKKDLRLLAFRCIKDWTVRFPNAYPSIDLTYDYLHRVLQINFGQSDSPAMARRRAVQERVDEMQLTIRLNRELDLFRADRADIESTLRTVEESFRILVPLDTPCIDEEVDTVNSSAPVLSGVHLEVPISTMITIVISEDNNCLVQNMADAFKQISKTHLPRLQRVLKLCGKVRSAAKELPDLLELKNRAKLLKQQYSELRFVLDATGEASDESHEEFIDVPADTTPMAAPNRNEATAADDEFLMAAFGEDRPSTSQQLGKNEDRTRPAGISRPSTSQKLLYEIDHQLPPLDVSLSSREMTLREKLMATAPVVPFSTDLLYWGRESDIPCLSKASSGHRFWATSHEGDEYLPESVKEQLTTRISTLPGKFEPILHACRAPLPSGRLCPRMDRYRCPFHGPIVLRDSTGGPLDLRLAEKESRQRENQLARRNAQLTMDIQQSVGNSPRLGDPPRGLKRFELARHRYGRLSKGITGSWKETSAGRIKKKVLSSKSIRKMDEADRRLNQMIQDEKFGCQFNYSLRQ